MRYSNWLAVMALLSSSFVQAQGADAAISKDSASITRWATGYLDYVPGTNVDAQWKTPGKALGKAIGDSFDVVVLGDGGRITLTFGGSIVNGTGADFAVFENAFNDTFLELARVEVSSDGVTFARFPALSFTPEPVNGFGNLDPDNIYGFAGKYRQGLGTPFDLADLAGVAGLDVNNIRHVRIVDVIGNGSALDDNSALFGGPQPIYDPYPQIGSAGFDLDAVGVLHFAAAPVPEPGQFALFGAGIVLLSHIVRRRHRGIVVAQTSFNAR